VVVTPSPTASTDATLGQGAMGGGHGVSTGKVVGIVLGVAAGVAALVGLGIWFWFRRRRQNNESTGAPPSTFTARTGDLSPTTLPSRQVSQMSSSGLLGSKAPRINTQGMTQGPDPRSADTASTGLDRRSLATDQRLNPYALYFQPEARHSDVSLQDNQDYSRQLRVSISPSRPLPD
jgi:LPXTG-motif cell wall-anchored protein